MIEIDKLNLLVALDFVSGAIKGKSLLPILDNIHLEAVGDALILSATNLEVSARTQVPCVVKDEFATTINYKALTDVLKVRPETMFKMTYKNETESIRISSGRWWTLLKGIPSQDYPILPTKEGLQGVEYETTVNPELLLQEAGRVAFCVARDNARPVLNNIYIHEADGNMYMVATDGFRLARVKTSLESQADFKAIIGTQFVDFLNKASKLSSDPITLTIGNKIAIFSNDYYTISMQLSSGSYPDYEPIIPDLDNPVSLVGMKASKLSIAIRSCLIFAKFGNSTVHSESDGESFKVSGISNEIGSAEEVVDTNELENEEFKIAFNGNYVLDVLSQVDENISYMFYGNMNPIVMTNNKEDSVWVIMPMHA